jgi:two-component system response regulator DesR
MLDAITVVIIEDQLLVLDALTQLLNREPGIRVVGSAADGETGIALVERHRPRVVLADIEMPRMDGLAVAATLRHRCPESVVAMLTTFGRPGYLERAIAAGVQGFLLKEQPVAELALSIRRLAAGERVIDPDLALATLEEGPNPLSAREQEILRQAEAGADVAAIARALHLSPGTVRNYLSDAMQKLYADNRVQAIRVARERGWI